uniref:Uncharacterized protein n=1 Tax=Arundo donax TaxID=35708 RepID=A0A0A9HW85_ARUDO
MAICRNMESCTIIAKCHLSSKMLFFKTDNRISYAVTFDIFCF